MFLLKIAGGPLLSQNPQATWLMFSDIGSHNYIVSLIEVQCRRTQLRKEWPGLGRCGYHSHHPIELARGRVLRNPHRGRVLRDQIIITERIRTSSRVAARTIISGAVTLILRSIIMDHRLATAGSEPAHQTKESTRTPLSLLSPLILILL